jgi:SnoaL-like domain
MGDSDQMAAEFEAAYRSGDMGAMAKLAVKYGTPDFVQEWPQSGERLNLENSLKLFESYGEMTSGPQPTFTYKRMLGAGDHFLVEGTIDYGDGTPVSYVAIGDLRDGRVAKMTEYFANPFPAPEWRAAFVEKG